ncbi:MAG: RES family NAD+ phosphorylase [Nitrosospira sp.]|nr:RES family NAD+ phosphorylase [Nitrosospira sp.]MDN5882975.1 RES family NAD+ phosphorylase [Nitrosospira sp.]MDN5935869.1 RES family NAD+ phosphorylase [Nitrosospira sp.]
MASPYFHSWKKDHGIHRIHENAYRANEFNASGRGDARFSPLADAKGKVIPTLYGGNTFICAAMETVFHDLPDQNVDDYILDFNDLDSLAVSRIHPVRELRLLSLVSRYLIPLKLKKTQVIETPVTDYPATTALALDWHTRYPDIDGLYWTSRQDDAAQACMLFGDRISEADLKIELNSDPLQGPVHVKNLVDLARELGISKGHAFPSSIVGF